MSGYYSDTHPEMEALQIRLLREVPSWRKMELLISLNASAQELALAGLKRRFPNASADELRRRLADILLGQELARKVYGEPEYAEADGLEALCYPARPIFIRAELGRRQRCLTFWGIRYSIIKVRAV
jgi:hypothetical protein